MKVDITKKQVKKIFKGRIGKVRILAILVSCILYYIIIDFYDKKLNVFEFTRFVSKDYTLYTGTKGGKYFDIGQALDNYDNNYRWKFNKFLFDINVTSEITAGGYQNALKVLTNSRSFGLVEDDIYSDNDLVRQQLNYVSPLYIERMHFLYSKEKFENKEIIISSNTDKQVLSLLAKRKIATGPIGSGTKILASYIFSELNDQIKKNNEKDTNLIGNNLLGTSLKDVYLKLKTGEIAAMMVIAGVKIASIDSLLATGKFGLISIDPSLTSELNQKYNLNLRITDFKNISTLEAIYSKINIDKVATFGTYCYLVSNKQIPPSDVRLMLMKIKKLAEKPFKDENHFKDLPLNEFNFLDTYENTDKYAKASIIRNLLLFLSSVIISSITILSFYVWAISKIKHDACIDQLAEIAKDVPDNLLPREEYEKYEKFMELSTEKKQEDIIGFLVPEINDDQVKIISLKIIPSIHKLIESRIYLTSSFSDGELTDEHYTFLMERIDYLVNKFRKSLGLRLNELLSRESMKNTETLHLLRKYCTADYLTWDDYKTLKDLIVKQ